MAKHIANILSGCRILGSVLLLFFPAFSLEFYITYVELKYSAIVVCFVATLSAMREGVYVILDRKYR